MERRKHDYCVWQLGDLAEWGKVERKDQVVSCLRPATPAGVSECTKMTADGLIDKMQVILLLESYIKLVTVSNVLLLYEYLLIFFEKGWRSTSAWSGWPKKASLYSPN